jgi:hypothetical protein
VPVRQAAQDEFTIGSFDVQRLFDTADDAGLAEPVLTAAAFDNRLNKLSRAIRNVMRAPDIMGIAGSENLATLQAVANRVNADAVGAGQSNPAYQAYLQEGPDPTGIDCGFLVKAARVTVVDVTQSGASATT